MVCLEANRTAGPVYPFKRHVRLLGVTLSSLTTVGTGDAHRSRIFSASMSLTTWRLPSTRAPRQGEGLLLRSLALLRSFILKYENLGLPPGVEDVP
ncbi:hypothetical protein GFL91_19850 [Rhizobium leguminosarum bv. viciae]|uniref:Uncharacterized protein n=1 Tax=Rhizobium leguminosarum bv. viciae TaxID=387 RepID=A0A8I2KGD7_RHILV|nr:hypothetical protein [Rhizobium leguminosarum bv. viciae]